MPHAGGMGYIVRAAPGSFLPDAPAIHFSGQQRSAYKPAGQWRDLVDFPEDLQCGKLYIVDVRGRVKIHTHCYEAVDLDGLRRKGKQMADTYSQTPSLQLSNEFQFPIAAHNETYLVLDLLKQAYDPGHNPAAAIFGDVERPFNSWYLLFEAQQVYFYGSWARTTALDSFEKDTMQPPAPKQVWIDGIPQLESPYVSEKPASVRRPPLPRTPTKKPQQRSHMTASQDPTARPGEVQVRLCRTRKYQQFFARTGGAIQQVYSATDSLGGVVVVKDGVFVWHGAHSNCLSDLATAGDAEWIDLEGGSIS
ncbi:hypothetical protein BJ138DRAFT_1119528 [Hygrophoropsis aurantiaca]|uniref:Uncharacterized protein n=1 Tax=Hygrophoropsis aurantiaca TaxID=72124 RepID=A0ACB7ZUB4_9AGAM|nr:hypothetical protein BJ138DRAFT_1119528 [Hygrophoropsis aurantiaca]